jgi:hypothetical protein
MTGTGTSTLTMILSLGKEPNLRSKSKLVKQVKNVVNCSANSRLPLVCVGCDEVVYDRHVDQVQDLRSKIELGQDVVCEDDAP